MAYNHKDCKCGEACPGSHSGVFSRVTLFASSALPAPPALWVSVAMHTSLLLTDAQIPLLDIPSGGKALENTL